MYGRGHLRRSFTRRIVISRSIPPNSSAQLTNPYRVPLCARSKRCRTVASTRGDGPRYRARNEQLATNLTRMVLVQKIPPWRDFG